MASPARARKTVVVASRNPHKLAEVRRVLAAENISVEPLPDGTELPPEEGETFAENALPKARTAAAATDRPSIADDSGIEAEALGGSPGVRSARYAGLAATDEENLEKLMREAPAGSRLRYVCAIAYVHPGTGEERLFIGECRGRLAGERRGSRGFGYDPVFIPEEHGQDRTMAELTDEEKDAISHRGVALRSFARWLAQ